MMGCFQHRSRYFRLHKIWKVELRSLNNSPTVLKRDTQKLPQKNHLCLLLCLLEIGLDFENHRIPLGLGVKIDPTLLPACNRYRRSKIYRYQLSQRVFLTQRRKHPSRLRFPSRYRGTLATLFRPKLKNPQQPLYLVDRALHLGLVSAARQNPQDPRAVTSNQTRYRRDLPSWKYPIIRVYHRPLLNVRQQWTMTGYKK